MDRPTTILDLPITGYKAEVYTYFTKGEEMHIDSTLTEGVEMIQKAKASSPEDITVESKGIMLDRDDEVVRRTLEAGVKSITNEKGEKLNGRIVTLVLDLPSSDVDVIDEYLAALRRKKKASVSSTEESTTT